MQGYHALITCLNVNTRICQDVFMTPVLWLIVGVALIGAEVLSGEFVLVMLGTAALAAAGTAALGAPLRSEERRVGMERRAPRRPDQEEKTHMRAPPAS